MGEQLGSAALPREAMEKRWRSSREEVEKRLEKRQNHEERFFVTPIASRGEAALLMAQPYFS